MNHLDWIVLIGSLAFIVICGTVKTRKNDSLDGYLKGDNQMNWLTIGLSVMATQASAITFISTPGLAYEKGMSFVQNYFGLPIALIIVAAFFIPIYYKFKVFTAYEYLEHRFDVRTRVLAASLFLIQRGLAAGITIYAPAIILSTALYWDLNYTIIGVGLLVIIYTVGGGTKAVSMTQQWQMAIILIGMTGVFLFLVYEINQIVSLDQALSLVGISDKLEVVSFSTDPSQRYTFWTGITGGLFLALSYFGTDQSQVQRYIGGRNIHESRLGLMFNAVLKVPMQFFILLTGVLIFLFFEFYPHPVLFNQNALMNLKSNGNVEHVDHLENEHQQLWQEKRNIYDAYINGDLSKDQVRYELKAGEIKIADHKSKVSEYYQGISEGKSAKESDYVFLYFILNYLPHGIIGLLLCVIISAAMSSTSGEINALASTTSIDFYRRFSKAEVSPRRELMLSKLFTLLWGGFAIAFALFAHMVENLIEAVNILGSLFYGTILGIFIVAFFIKHIKARSVFASAICTQILILGMYFIKTEEIAYLWYNVIGCSGVVVLSMILEQVSSMSTQKNRD